jgi:biopolymer transport protein ExbB
LREIGSMHPKITTVGRRPSRGRHSGFATAVLLALATFVCWSDTAAAWWSEEWSLRKKITIDTGPSGANITDPIGATPVLIRLHVGNFRFAQAKDDGSDLRFVGADDLTPLKHHVDKYDSLLGEAYIWVNVPDVKQGAKSDIWLYYGNKKAPSTSDPKGSYDSDTVLVYHFSERGTPAQDSSPWANHAQGVGQAVDGAIIGSGLHLDGRTPLSLPETPSLAVPDGGALTVSLWAKAAALQPHAAIYSRRDGANGVAIGFDDGAPFVEISNNGTVLRSAAGAPVAPNGWHDLTLTATPGFVALYLDGNLYATLNGTLPPLTGAALLGGDVKTGAPQTPAPLEPASSPSSPSSANSAAAGGFAGEIDELEISLVARSSGFIKAAAIGQGPEHEKLIGYGPDEETASWLNGYFAVILKSVTLDGWVVIGVLVFMAIVSWVVMIDKAIFVVRQARANARFKIFSQHTASDFSSLEGGDADNMRSLGGRLTASNRRGVRHSSLYRLYCIGAEEIRRRFIDAEAPKVLSPQSIAAVRAALEGGVVGETQKLNRLMILLTIAISGGPFLGLLGTVVGVMITFAAIAASGDVNVNAIAPGIAAALVATVAGLGVAIPALFGYNYLISQIKDLSADMQIFVNEFTTRVAEFYDSSPSRQPRSLAAE